MGQADGELVLRAPLPDEAQAVADVLNAVMLEERGTATETAEGVLNGWQTPGFDPVRHARLVFLPEGVLAGYVELWTPPAFPMPWSFGGVRPDLRGRGAGTALLGWAQQEALSSVAAMPAGERVVHQTGAYNFNDAARDLFEAHGYALVRRFWRMEIDLDPASPPPFPTWPEGVTLRAFVPGADNRAVYDAYNDAFQDHWQHQVQPFKQWLHNMTNGGQYDPAAWFLAVADGPAGEEIAGFALCNARSSEDPDAAGVRELGVRRPWRRRGIAGALLQHVFAAFHRRGTTRVGLGVDAQNQSGATRLYEKAGMRPVRSWDIYEKELHRSV